jgi:NAD(P)-dependent dehydrogenase (short-subunit alcohol dehydrogenase family)
MNNPDGKCGRLFGRVAIITGGTSGIGKVTALLFATEGATVVITGRRAKLGEAVVAAIKENGGGALFIAADHIQLEDCRRVVDKTLAEYGRVDILFNNAGVVMGGRAEDTSEEDWQYTLNLNVTAVWRMSRLVIPHMRNQGGGVIVNNASDWGVVGARDAVVYCVSKGAVVQMTRAMALDHARENIRINAVCPGDTFVERWLEAGYFKGSEPKSRKEIIREAADSVPTGRVAQAEEIAKAVLFLASDDSSAMTGGLLLMDGGNTAQ